MKFGLIGYGSWGRALNQVLHDNKIETIICDFSKNADHNNTSSNLSTLKDCNYYLIAVPSFAIRQTLENLYASLGSDLNIIIATKGIEDLTYKTCSEITNEIFKSQVEVSILSGPTHAEEVSARLATTIVIASKNVENREELKKIFKNDYLKVYSNPDVLGVELGGIIKNVLAIAAGVSIGLGNKDNAQAAIITRAMREIILLGEAIGAKRETLMGLSGLGDLIVTCSSKYSRNRTFGIYLGQGYSKDQAVKKVGATIEGIYSLNAIYHLAQNHNLNLKLINSVYAIVSENQNPSAVAKKMMEREAGDE